MDHVGEDDELLNKVASVTLGAAQLSRTTQNESMAFEGRYAEEDWTERGETRLPDCVSVAAVVTRPRPHYKWRSAQSPQKVPLNWLL